MRSLVKESDRRGKRRREGKVNIGRWLKELREEMREGLKGVREVARKQNEVLRKKIEKAREELREREKRWKKERKEINKRIEEMKRENEKVGGREEEKDIGGEGKGLRDKDRENGEELGTERKGRKKKEYKRNERREGNINKGVEEVLKKIGVEVRIGEYEEDSDREERLGRDSGAPSATDFLAKHSSHSGNESSTKSFSHSSNYSRPKSRTSIRPSNFDQARLTPNGPLVLEPKVTLNGDFLEEKDVGSLGRSTDNTTVMWLGNLSLPPSLNGASRHMVSRTTTIFH
ncbi:hypothetical protein G5I_06258 [Acromyrmex echinatior]|uniref:Uncharacterized protein n=1 Tax=Acromyrmex echinatior TaxID=103372 RepID=F4WKJ6_ACREC|nr:hypothetical protein G5I_06258 [Acromyrmex echinatior]